MEHDEEAIQHLSCHFLNCFDAQVCSSHTFLRSSTKAMTGKVSALQQIKHRRLFVTICASLLSVVTPISYAVLGAARHIAFCAIPGTPTKRAELHNLSALRMDSSRQILNATSLSRHSSAKNWQILEGTTQLSNVPVQCFTTYKRAERNGWG